MSNQLKLCLQLYILQKINKEEHMFMDCLPNLDALVDIYLSLSKHDLQ